MNTRASRYLRRSLIGAIACHLGGNAAALDMAAAHGWTSFYAAIFIAQIPALLFLAWLARTLYD